MLEDGSTIVIDKDALYKKELMIQVKSTRNNNIVGFVKLSLEILKAKKSFKDWVPLFQDRDHYPIKDLENFQQEEDVPRLLIDLKIQEDMRASSDKKASPHYLSPQSHSINNQQQNQYRESITSQSPIDQKDDYSNGGYEEISENITLIQARPEQESFRNSTYSGSQQVYRKKKKTYTQSADPNIQLLPRQDKANKSQHEVSLDHSQPLIKEELLQELQPMVNQDEVRVELNTQIEVEISKIVEINDLNSKDLTSWYLRTRQVAFNDQKDQIQNEQRIYQLNSLVQHTQALQQNFTEKVEIKQNLETKLQTILKENQTSQKRERLQKIQELTALLKQELQQLSAVSELKLSENRSQLQQSIEQLKKQLLYEIQELKQQPKTLLDKVHEEVDQIKDSLLETQNLEHQEIEKLAQEKMDYNFEYLGLESDFVNQKQEALSLQQQVDQQNIQANFLHKQVLQEQQQIKNLEQQYKELLKKQQQVVSQEKEVLYQERTKVEELRQNITRTKEQLQKEKLVQDQYLSEKEQGSNAQKFKEVQDENNATQIQIQKLRDAINQQKLALKEFEITNQNLAIILEQSTSENVFNQGSTSDQKTRLKDKNDLLETKELKLIEIQSQIETLNSTIQTALNKQDIHKEFQERVALLDDKEAQLNVELQKIRKVQGEFSQWQEEQLEKLQIQDQDIRASETEIKRQQDEMREQKSTEQQRLDALLAIKTQNELENQLREIKSQIRDMEAILRGRDHEIDTLELINSQKDSVIIELEENAGRFKEVVKEVHYEQQKNDRVENTLNQYLQSHPMKVEMKKLGDGYYKFGTKRIYMRLDNDQRTLMVRVGPKEYITLSLFIIENEGIELQKMGIGKALASRFKN